MEQQPITIFVHGTLPPDAVMSIPPVRSFFFCQQGMSKAADLDEKFHTHKIAKLLCSAESAEFQLPHFYLFGWSGDLSFAARKKAAAELYAAIRKLVIDYEKQNLMPRITLITHSHGGNVALSIKEIAQEPLPIEQLILLACPVQVETAPYVKEPFFHKIYSIHSHSDMFQVLDPQGIHQFLENLKYHGLEFTISHLKQLGPLFSSRHFEPAQHITQLNVRYPRRELFHVEFLLPSFVSSLPSLLALMREQNNPKGLEITHVFKQ